MKEQIQTPFDSRGESNEKDQGSKPKSLSRPSIAEGLQKPKFDLTIAKANLWRKCSCGNPICDSPMTVSPNNPWVWHYFDKVTNERVYDESLPRQGGEPGDVEQWDHR